jgi:hypothetical protein
MGSVRRIFKKGPPPMEWKDPQGNKAPQEIQDLGNTAFKGAMTGKSSSEIQKDVSALEKKSPTGSATKETLGSSKKKKRLRDGRRSLISGSAMGVSDKLG